MISVPYSIELNDIALSSPSLPATIFIARSRSIDQIYARQRSLRPGARARLHPFVIGQPFRLKYLAKALDYIAAHEGVWLTTSDDVAAALRSAKIAPLRSADRRPGTGGWGR